MEKTCRIICTAIIISVTAMLSGCYGGEQVGDRAFVRALGVGRSENGYEMEVLIYDGSEEVKVSGTGESIGDALENCGENAGRTIYLGHIEKVILGEYDGDILKALADKGMPLSCEIEIAGVLSRSKI